MPQPAWQLQNWQRTVQTRLTQMTLSDRSHAAEEREYLQSLAPNSMVSMILRIQTRLAIKACDDSKKMGFFPPGKSAQSPLAPALLLPGMLSPQLWLISKASEEGKN